jgi:2'-5' RNA ligase
MAYNGCVYLRLDTKHWDSVIDIFNGNEADLYRDPNNEIEFGVEFTPHITLLYGLNSINFNEQLYYKLALPIKQYNVDIGGVNIFENEKYHVLYLSAICDALYDQNKILTDNFDFENEYNKYVPHITIAYLKPDIAISTMYQYILTSIFNSGECWYTPIPKNYVYSFGVNRKISFTK